MSEPQIDCIHPMCAATPRVSQRIAEDEWPAGSLLGGGDRAYWSDRACGAAALQSVLAFHGYLDESLFATVREAVRGGGYGPAGWWHAALARQAAKRGVPAVTSVVSQVAELRDCIAATQSPLIASVTLGFPDDGRKGGHLVVVSAVDASGRVCVRDPSSWGVTHDRVDGARFMASFSGRVVLFGRVPALPEIAD